MQNQKDTKDMGLVQMTKIKLTVDTIAHLMTKAMEAKQDGRYEDYLNYRDTALDLEHSLVNDCRKLFS